MSKYFIGGLQVKCTEDDVRESFSKYGAVKQIVIMRERATNKSRGFGFVQFHERVNLIPPGKESVYGYLVCGRAVELKHAVPRNEEEARDQGIPFNPSLAEITNGNGGKKNAIDIHKAVVVQGFPTDITEADISSYFQMFGPVERVELSENNTIAKIAFEDAPFVEVILSMKGSLTMDGRVLTMEHGVEYERRTDPPKRPRERDAVAPPPPAPRSPPVPPAPAAERRRSPPPQPPAPQQQRAPAHYPYPTSHYPMESAPAPPPPPPPPMPPTPPMLYALLPVTIMPPLPPQLHKYLRILRWSPELETFIQPHLEEAAAKRSRPDPYSSPPY
jgi:RNA recognition motif-containing protein